MSVRRVIRSVCGLILGAAMLATAGCGGATSTVASQPVAVTAMKPTTALGDEELAAKIDEVVDFTESRYMNAKDHAAWQIVHGILAYGYNLKIYVDGELVSALEHLMKGGQLRGWHVKPGDRGLEAIVEPGSKTGQGHEDQWVGYLSQCGLEWDDPIVVGDQTFKFGDLVTQAQWDVYEGMEASWTLMALSAYLPSNSTWTAKDGQEWSIERLIAMESAQDLSTSACGGAHRMGGIAMALNRHLAEGSQLTGGWKLADDKVQECIRKAREFQQPDGTFSTNYWIRASSSPDAGQRLSTTGHTLEFLTLAMTDKQLQEPWVRRAVVELCNLLEQTRDLPVECGGLYHTAHGLELYRLRRFGPREVATANVTPATAEPLTTEAPTAP
jgi:hypothetical protein